MFTQEERLKRCETAVTDRKNYEAMWDDVARYCLMVRQPFQSTVTKGGFLNDGSLFANVGITAARSFATAVMGSCWRGAELSVKLVPPPLMDEDAITQTEKQYVKDSKKFAFLLDNLKTDLNMALQAAMTEFTVYGTGAYTISKTERYPYLKAKVIPLKHLFLTIDEEELFVREELNGPAFLKKYPAAKNLTAALRTKLAEEKTVVKVMEHIFPRPQEERAQAGVLSLEYGSQVFLPEETGPDGKKGVYIADESGYADFPVFVAKCNQLAGELYGRGLSMDALPALMEMNAAREMFTIACEFKIDPVLWSYATSFNNGQYNKSPGAINTPNLSGLQASGGVPLGPVFTVGSVAELLAHMEALVTIIKEHFYIDKLFDLNNDSRMTLGEALIRKTLRDDAVNPFYMTIFTQWLQPGLTYSAKSYREQGLILQDTDSVIETFAEQFGTETFELEFISPAARSMKSADLKNYLDMFGVLGNASALLPDIMDNYDGDIFARMVPKMTGTSEEALRTEVDVIKIRKKRSDAAAQELESERNQQDAAANNNNASALAAERNANTAPFQDAYSRPI